MNLHQMQLDHREFIVEMGWANTKTPLEAVALFHEEVAELGHELRQREVSDSKVSDELADIVLRAMDLASDLQIDLEIAVLQKIAYNNNHIDDYKAKGRVK